MGIQPLDPSILDLSGSQGSQENERCISQKFENFPKAFNFDRFLLIFAGEVKKSKKDENLKIGEIKRGASVALVGFNLLDEEILFSPAQQEL